MYHGQSGASQECDDWNVTVRSPEGASWECGVRNSTVRSSGEQLGIGQENVARNALLVAILCQEAESGID